MWNNLKPYTVKSSWEVRCPTLLLPKTNEYMCVNRSKWHLLKLKNSVLFRDTLSPGLFPTQQKLAFPASLEEQTVRTIQDGIAPAALNFLNLLFSLLKFTDKLETSTFSAWKHRKNCIKISLNFFEYTVFLWPLWETPLPSMKNHKMNIFLYKVKKQSNM